jgi:hypothetical protein
VSLRVSGKIPELWNPVTGTTHLAQKWKIKDNRTILPLRLDAGESVFIVLQKPTKQTASEKGENWADFEKVVHITSPWTVQFNTAARGPKQPIIFETLTGWNTHTDPQIRYYSGTAVYSNSFDWNGKKQETIYLELENIYNLATVKINGIDCGTIWTKPYRVDISNALKQGSNTIEIAVTNTWANRIMGDENFNAEPDESKRIWTNARYRVAEKILVKSGLTGEVKIVKEL